MRLDQSKKENIVATAAIDVFYKVHRAYGPGLYEKTYEDIICYELRKAGIFFERQKAIPLIHEDMHLDAGFRADIILDNCVIVEIKSVECLAPVHFKQLQTYLRLANKKLGLLVNFNVNLLKDGLNRIANNL